MANSTAGQRPSMQVLRTVWGALLCSHFLLIVVLLVVPREAVAVDPILLPVLAGAGVMSALASLVVPRLLYRKNVATLQVQRMEVPDPAGMPGFGKSIVVAERSKNVMNGLLARYVTRVILGCALAEATSLYGFILKFLGHDWIISAPFFAVGIALALTHFPRESVYVRDAEAALKLKFGEG